MESDEIIKRLDRIKDLPTLPAIAMEVNRMLQDYSTSIESLNRVIKKDQAISAKLLKLVNSSFFGVRSQVSTIPDALVLLGFNAIRNVVLSVSLIKSFPRQGEIEAFDMNDFWKHSIGVAITSRYLAEVNRFQQMENCFVGGLLHDIGKVILAQHFHDVFQEIVFNMRDSGLSFFETEKRSIAYGHAEIGEYLAKRWQLPEVLTDAILSHHMLGKGQMDSKVNKIIHVANIIVNIYMPLSFNSKNESESIRLPAINPDAFRIMRPQLETVSIWFPRVMEEIEGGCEFFLETRKKDQEKK